MLLKISIAFQHRRSGPAFFAAFEVFCGYHGYRRATTGRWNLAK
jgi:hypothetical protein